MELLFASWIVVRTTAPQARTMTPISVRYFQTVVCHAIQLTRLTRSVQHVRAPLSVILVKMGMN